MRIIEYTQPSPAPSAPRSASEQKRSARLQEGIGALQALIKTFTQQHELGDKVLLAEIAPAARAMREDLTRFEFEPRERGRGYRR